MELECLKAGDDERFRQLYAIYAASIVAREQKPQEWLGVMLRTPQYQVWIASEGRIVQGFSILFMAPAAGFALFEYMAVAPEQRNRGLGGELFRKTVQRAVTPQGRKPPVLLEIDSDRETSSDRVIRVRREAFYRRLGCARIAGLRYLMPLPGHGPPPEMDLMIYTEAPLPSLRLAELKRWLQTIYRDVYRCAPEDARIDEMTRNLPDPIGFD